MNDFSALALHEHLLRALSERGISAPTPIQAQAIPLVLAGQDVMGAAQTGTGKTAAFALPLLQRMLPHGNTSTSPARHVLRALILTPTRELAEQVGENVKLYARYTPLRVAVVYGGIAINQQIEQLRSGIEILIATPGRLLDHLGQKNLQLSQIEIVVLDEADRMLDMGFLPDIEKILQTIPEQRQTLLFSATFSPDIRKLARRYLREPAEIEISAPNSTAKTVTQIAYRVGNGQKRDALQHLVANRGHAQIIVFVNTKTAAGDLARFLSREGVAADAIHGDKQQLERNRVLDSFKSGSLKVLVATDVAARGLDIAGVPCVINFDVPTSPEDYVHRIGRTGRAGLTGEAISLIAADDERSLSDIQKLIGMQLTVETAPQFESAQVAAMPSHERLRTRERRSGASDRNRAQGESAIRQRGSSGRSQPIDDWFNRPYEAKPEAAAAPHTADALPSPVNRSSRSGLSKVGALLGGRKKTEV